MSLIVKVKKKKFKFYLKLVVIFLFIKFIYLKFRNNNIDLYNFSNKYSINSLFKNDSLQDEIYFNLTNIIIKSYFS